VVHDRNAHQETLSILKEEKAFEVGGVIHCFSGDYEMASKCLNMGFYISIPGTITFKNAKSLQEVVRSIPLDRILLETDSPFLTPMPFRGKRNEPSYVRYIAEKIAKIKKLDLEEVASVTSQNVKTLFQIPT
jgi:TatD DNase family protein